MATLKDVAREAGLSVGTVSRVLNNRGYISDETRQSVNRAMKKLNYQPNEMARSLSKRRSNMIGVIVPSISHPYFSKLVESLESKAHEEEYEILLFVSQGRVDREEEYVRACISNRVAGLILCTGSVRTARLKNLGFPVVAYERLLNDADAGVECDNYEGGSLAAEELIRCGCRNLLCISGVGEVSMPADVRRNGFVDVCARHEGISVRSFACSEESISDLDYKTQLQTCMDQNPGVDGVFASSDVIAAELLGVLRERGLRIPEDVQVIGYDDVFVSELTTPELTTIHQPVQEMAQTCIDIIRQAAAGETFPSRTVLRVKLIRRGSTRTIQAD